MEDMIWARRKPAGEGGRTSGFGLDASDASVRITGDEWKRIRVG
jgi:hypothetical protein